MSLHLNLVLLKQAVALASYSVPPLYDYYALTVSVDKL